MARAPSTLPFALEPEPVSRQPSPLLAPGTPDDPNPNTSLNYIPSTCRAGPMQTSSLKLTNKLCLLIYLVLTLTMVVLFLVNYFSGPVVDPPSFLDLSLPQKIVFSLNGTLIQVFITCGCMVAISMILLLLVIMVPAPTGLITVGLCLAGLLYIAYATIVLNTTETTYVVGNHVLSSSSFKICLIVLTIFALILSIVLIIFRAKKFKYLSPLMKIVQAVILENLPGFPIVMLFGLNAVCLLLWVVFTKLLWNCFKMGYSQSLPIPNFLVTLLVLACWNWTHGIMVAISHYICQSWVISWYYNHNRESKQGFETGLRGNWRSEVFQRLFKYHLGTVIFGGLVEGYVSTSVIFLLRKLVLSRWNFEGTVIHKLDEISEYTYVETILQCMPYGQATVACKGLRNRIKNKIPEVYMLGHFVQALLKITLIIAGIYLWFVLCSKLQAFFTVDIIGFSSFFFFLFTLILGLGIFYQVSNNISHLFGMVNDVAVIAYCVDCEVERVHFQSNQPHSTPDGLKSVYQELAVTIRLNPNVAALQETLEPKMEQAPRNE